MSGRALGGAGFGGEVGAPMHSDEHKMRLCAYGRDAGRKLGVPVVRVLERQVGAARCTCGGGKAMLRRIDRKTATLRFFARRTVAAKADSRSVPVPAWAMPVASSHRRCSSNACGP